MSRNSPGLSAKIRVKVIARDGKNCHFCSRVTYGTGGTACTIDHIVPRYWGGKNRMENYVIACRDCNNKKSNTIDYCMCNQCRPVVVKHMLTDIYAEKWRAHHKPRVSRYTRPRKHGGTVSSWLVTVRGIQMNYPTFHEAINHALMERSNF